MIGIASLIALIVFLVSQAGFKDTVNHVRESLMLLMTACSLGCGAILNKVALKEGSVSTFPTAWLSLSFSLSLSLSLSLPLPCTAATATC